jgi:ATP-binding cassette subfamily C protein
MVLLMGLVLYVSVHIYGEPVSSMLVMGFLFYRLAGRLGEAQINYQSVVIGESAFWSLQESVEAAQRLEEARGGTLSPPPTARGIELCDVSFSYGDRNVLHGVSLSIPAGRMVALSGPSGAGKTTIADLIVGLYQPLSGEVLIDGIPLQEIDTVAWRQMIGYVPQEMFLFHDTLLENITLGDPTITRADVDDALEAAGATEFVVHLPHGLDTVMGERGARLSGGQRQRLAIARALARKPRLLVLDEVTTALDPRTEAAICATLRELRGRVTILSISHQPAMMAAADVVYRLDAGRATLDTSRKRTVEVAVAGSGHGT